MSKNPIMEKIKADAGVGDATPIGTELAIPISVGELYAKEFPPNDWVVDLLVAQSGITLLFGTSQSFKTWLLLEIAKSVAKGSPFLNQFPTIQGKVLIVDGENRPQKTRDRMRMLGVDAGADIYTLSKSGFKATNKQHIESLLAFCKDNSITLIIFDSLTRIHGGDENSSQDMSRAFEELERFTREDVSVLVIHHSNKGSSHKSAEDALRGSGDIFNVADSVLMTKRRGNADTTTVKLSKHRDSEELESFAVRLSVEDEKALLEYLGEAKKTQSTTYQAKDVVLSVLSSFSEGLTKTELCNAVREGKTIGKNAIGKAINELIAENKIVTEKGEKRSILCKLNKETV